MTLSLPTFQGIENQDSLLFVLSPKDGARARNRWVGDSITSTSTISLSTITINMGNDKGDDLGMALWSSA